MIQIKNLYKRYHLHKRSNWVLRDINIYIPDNVSVGLIGRNGAGKSTLLRLIGGLDYPDKGEIKYDCSISWPMGLGSGFLSQLTGRQNVKFVARVHGFDANIDEIIDFVQDFSEIGNYFDEPVRTYSSGMRARITFGLSLAFDFDVYLSDEATAVGDRKFREKATNAFRNRINKSSIIIVSHSEQILKDLCQAGVFLNEGHAYWFDDIKDALNAYHDIELLKN